MQENISVNGSDTDARAECLVLMCLLLFHISRAFWIAMKQMQIQTHAKDKWIQLDNNLFS